MTNSGKLNKNKSPLIENQQTLIIFTRYPEAGKTKTRLIPALGEKGAAEFQRQMTEITINKAKKLKNKIPVNIEVHFQGGNQELMTKWLGKNFIFKAQKEGDLGAKMRNSFQQVLSKNNQKAIIIGIDCPDLNELILEEAFEACYSNDLVIGPAQDGGYYLIGLNRVIPELFRGIPWGSNQVLTKTENIAQKLRLKTHQLPLLNDIDRPEDLNL